METCIVCCKSNNDASSRITTISTEWKEWHIQRIIEKHLWWWYLRPAINKESQQWICCHCWQEISTFHNFYVKVENENKHFNSYFNSNINYNVEELTTSVDIKLEEQNLENCSLLTENLMLLEKPKRGRKKKITNSTKYIQIEQLPLKGVKNEDDELEDIPELTKTELDISSMLETDVPDTMDWENCFLNDSNDSIDSKIQVNDLVHKDDNKLNKLNSKARRKTKRQTKSKSVNKPKRKYAQTRPRISGSKNDKFIAENKFDLSCSICNVSSDNFNNLKIHFLKEHNMVGYAMCCNKKFYKRCFLVDHINVHRDPNYFKCDRCDKAFTARASYEKHMETHQLYENRETVFTCDICKKSFLKKPVYERHVLIHVPEEERKFQCELCDKKFASDGMRKQHQTLTHLKKYAKFCDICGKSLRDNFSFELHMAEHSGQPPAKVKCEICGAELTNKYLLRNHIRMNHTEENQQEQICPYCSKISPNVRAHKHHIKYAHTMERKHACHMCEKKFRRPLELKEHLSTHTGEPLYTCPHCPRTFISNANMYKHRRLTHRKEWEEAKMKKDATALARKRIIKSATVENGTPYKDVIVNETELVNDMVANVIDLDF
ncbi:uncharacterized protein ACRADG_006973 [Cochliomyia hominivorax]